MRDSDVARLTYRPFIKNAKLLKDGYKAILGIWHELDMPDFFIEEEEGEWKACDEKTHDAHFHYHLKRYRVVRHSGEVLFHHRHGYRIPEWYLNIYHSDKETRVMIGGYGSGKTMNAVAEKLFYAATLPNYRGLFLAPFENQVGEAFTIANNLTVGTPYAEHFIDKMVTKPKRWIMGSSELGWDNIIEGYSVLHEFSKVLTITADDALLDQAEAIVDLDGLLRDVMTRFRGQIKGRERIGKITMLANARDNQNLWEIHEQGELGDPDILCYSPETGNNFYLTVRDMIRYEGKAGRTPEERLVAFAGKKPRMGGEQFPESSLMAMQDPELDLWAKEAEEANNPHWEFNYVDGIGHVVWERPRQPNRTYTVVADPGYDNPPYRNSPVIMVFDTTDFPLAPARLQAFHWVYGEQTPNPWIQKFSEMVVKYDAFTACGYDGTGAQSGYEKLNTGLSELGAAPIKFAGDRKFAYLNMFKKIVADALIKVPSIRGIFSQMGKYRLPDKDMRQDIVACLIVLAAMLEDSYMEHLKQADSGENKEQPYGIRNQYRQKKREQRKSKEKDRYAPRAFRDFR